MTERISSLIFFDFEKALLGNSVSVVLLVLLLVFGCRKDDPSTPPKLSTLIVNSIETNTAISGGEITSSGNAKITGRGVCWSLNSNPTVDDSKTTDGSGSGSFTSTLIDLLPGNTYHVRAYAINSVGTSYGLDLTFTTKSTLPSVTTTTITSIAATVGTSGGNITSDGGAAITSRGVCWSTTSNPTISDPKTIDGSGTGGFSSSISGLSAGQTYHVRAYATNINGTVYGAEITFNTSATTALVTTTPIFSISNISASSGGTITSDGGSAITARGVCWNTTANPLIVHPRTFDGFGLEPYSSSIVGLSAGITYHVRAYATNSVGTAYGNDISFTTTTVTTPELTTTIISSITTSTAISGGNITSDGGIAITARGICWSTASNPTTDNSKTIDGAGTGAFTSNLVGLTYGTTYHVRAYAINATCTAYGNDISFTTSAILPSLSTTTITNITGTSAASGGNILEDGGATVTARGVCWSTTSNPTIDNSKTNNDTGAGPFLSYITGLNSNTSYHARAYATNSIGTAYGNDLTFTTNTILQVPTLTTTSVNSIAASSASGGGNISSDGGAPILARGVCWGTSNNPTLANLKTTDGAGAGTFTSSITGLSSVTTYHVRSYATNSVGTAYGADIPFTTIANIPSISTSSITSITSSSASSGGTISADGGASVSERGVCWSTSSNPTTANSKLASGNGIGTFTISITGLTANTTYHVRAYAANSSGTAYGSDISFTTIATLPSISTNPISNINSSSALSGGYILSNGGSTITASGVCWSSSLNPTTTDSKTTDGTTVGSFTSSLTGLTASTTYHARAYATNSIGTAYGNDLSFTTSLPVPDNDNMLLGNPSDAITNILSPTNYLMIKPQFCLSYSNSKLTTNWTSWHLYSGDIGTAPRIDLFREDTSLPSGWYQVGASDYQYSTYGFDRGHMCPSADRTLTPEDNSSTFVMTNMIPQSPRNNQQTWANLENYSRTLVDGGKELFIISGPYGQGGTSAVGTFSILGSGVVVPNKTWKIIVVIDNGNNDLSRITTSTRVIAVLMPNDQSLSTDWRVHRVSVDALESLMGYDFLSNIPANIQSVIEASVDNL